MSVLSRENQHELCVYARKFNNLMPFGCWWFLNNPSIVEEITRERLEMLGTSFIPQHSDARVLEQVIYKWNNTRRTMARILSDSYRLLSQDGRGVTRADIQRDVTRLFRSNAEAWISCGRPSLIHRGNPKISQRNAALICRVVSFPFARAHRIQYNFVRGSAQPIRQSTTQEVITTLKSNARILTVALAKCALLSLFLIVASPAQDSTFHGAPPSAKQQKNPFEGQHPPSGKADYLSRCASCHGQNGEGTGNIPALATGKAQGASDGELFWYITKGDVNNGMPPWASLPEEQTMADHQLSARPRQHETRLAAR